MTKTHIPLQTVLMVTLLLLGVLGYLGYEYWTLREAAQNLQIELATTTKAFQEKVSELESSLEEATTSLSQTHEELKEEKNKVGKIAEEVEKITGTVDDLEKLNELDPELLQKYSKIYFLNEHHIPETLVDIELEHLYYEDQPQEILKEVWPYLEGMIEDAADDDAILYIRSGYRSFGTQALLKSTYSVTYGAGTANQFSADQGYSEHQLGTTVDFTTVGIQGGLAGFDTTPAYTWLIDNAHRYGFILSYPEDNIHYQYEPWHWRFVGSDLARYLARKEKSFYDLEQRDIDEYLLEIFD